MGQRPPNFSPSTSRTGEGEAQTHPRNAISSARVGGPCQARATPGRDQMGGTRSPGCRGRSMATHQMLSSEASSCEQGAMCSHSWGCSA